MRLPLGFSLLVKSKEKWPRLAFCSTDQTSERAGRRIEKRPIDSPGAHRGAVELFEAAIARD